MTSQPADKVNDLIDKKFRELAENLKNFGETEEKEDKKDKKSTCMEPVESGTLVHKVLTK